MRSFLRFARFFALCSLISSCGISQLPREERQATVSPIFTTPTVLPIVTGEQQPITITPASTISSITPVAPKKDSSATFALSSAEQTTPSDVLQEVKFGGGGGGAILCKKSSLPPTIQMKPEPAEWMQPYLVVACGWQPEDLIHITMQLPDGRVLSEDQRVQSPLNAKDIYYPENYAFFSYTPAASDPIGNYLFKFKGSDRQIQTEVMVIKPSQRRVYQINSAKLVLYNFSPNEHLRLFAYSNTSLTGVLKGWQDYRVDSAGQIVINVVPSYTYVVVGDISGEVHLSYPATLALYNAVRPIDAIMKPASQTTVQSLPSGGGSIVAPASSSTPSKSGSILLPRVYNVYICASPCQANGSNATRVFSRGVTTIYARWDYENIPIGAHYIRSWTMNSKEWVKYDCTWSGPVSGTDTVNLTEPGGLYSGNWEVKIVVNDQAILREQIQVLGDWTYWSPAGTFNSCYGKK